ncbi:MAG: glycosyltransferase family 4 protein [Candidatus Peribacteraceae bacterium]
MKILFTRFPFESRLNGGAERQVITLMEGLIARNNAAAFAGSCKALLTLCRERGIPSTELMIGPPPVTKWDAVSFAWRRKSMQRTLLSLLENFHDLDAVVMLSLSEKLLLTEEAAKKGIRVLWIEHDPVGRWLTANPWLPLLKRMSRHATIVTVSEMSRGVYLTMGFDPQRVVAIPNGIDLKRFEREQTTTNNTHSPLPPAHRSLGEGGKGEGLGEGGRVEHTDKALRIGTIARLDREKGLDLLITAIRDLPNVSLTIVGQGKEQQHLQTLIGGTPCAMGGPPVPNGYVRAGEGEGPASKSLPTSQPRNLAGADEEARGWAEGLWRAVRFLLLLFFVGLTKKRRERHKRQSQNETQRIQIFPNVENLASFYRSLSLFVLPSRTNDPFGLVAAEAMSLGVPVVVTDACGIASSLTNGENAVIVQAGDVRALRQGITSLLDPEKRKMIAEKGKTFATSEFSVHRMVERYENLLR